MPKETTSGPAWTIEQVRDRAIRKRTIEGLSLADVGALVGASASSVLRFEEGKNLAAEHFLAIAEWAGFELRKAS